MLDTHKTGPIQARAPASTRSSSGGSVATYGDFVEAMRRGQVVGSDNGRPFQISRLERKRNWAIPSFDFGRLLDPQNPRNLLHRIDLTDETTLTVEEGDKAFLFTIGEQRLILIQRFGVQDYPDDDDGPRFWYYRKVGDDPWANADSDAHEWAFLWTAATYLLNNPRVVATPGAGSVNLANKRRRLTGAKPLPETAVMSLTRRQTTGGSAKGTANGSPKRPHERAGHERRLADGRIVRVRSCRIRKGQSGPTRFVVRP